MQERRPLSACWRHFLDLISETDEERAALLQALRRQIQACWDQNKSAVMTYVAHAGSRAELGSMPSVASLEGGRPEPGSAKYRPPLVTFKRVIAESGEMRKRDEVLGNFFSDLSFADLVLKFPNAERLITPKLSPAFAPLGAFFETYCACMNIAVTGVERLSFEYLANERLAFFNALLFFSTLFYGRAEARGEPPGRTAGFLAEVRRWPAEGRPGMSDAPRKKLDYKCRVFEQFLQELRLGELGLRRTERGAEGLLTGADIAALTKQRYIHSLLQLPSEEELRDAALHAEPATARQAARLLAHSRRLMRGLTLFDDDEPARRAAKAAAAAVLPEHFKALVRRLLRLKLAAMGVYTRSFHDSAFEWVFVAVKAQEGMVRELAEAQRLSKAYELGAVDLLAFEPLDSRGRPYRFKKYATFAEFERLKRATSKAEHELFLANAREEFELEARGGDMPALGRLLKTLDDLTPFELYKLITLRVIAFKAAVARHFHHTLNNFSCTRIIKDTAEPRGAWHAFVLFSVLFEHQLRSVRRLAADKAFGQHRGMVYRLLASRSLAAVNRCFRLRGARRLGAQLGVRCLWDKVSAGKAYFPHAPFENGRHAEVWRSYEVNELGHRALFTQMERVKVVHKLLNSAFRLEDLLRRRLIEECFPLHDQYVLFGRSKLPLVAAVLGEPPARADTPLDQFFGLLRDESDPSDFLAPSVHARLAFRWNAPARLLITPIRDYFGERIALYFTFIVHFARAAAPLAFVGLVFQAVNVGLIRSQESGPYRVSTMVFMCAVVVWAVVFRLVWRTKEALFRLKHGQEPGADTGEHNVRPGFHGEHVRDPGSNELNRLFYPRGRRLAKMAATNAAALCVVLISLAVTLGILFWRRSISAQSSVTQYAVTLLNAVQIFAFNALFNYVVPKMVEFENHETLRSYEDSLIFKLFCFRFVNTFNSMFLIAFVKPFVGLFGQCVQQSNFSISNVQCFNELSYQVSSVLLVDLALSVALAAAGAGWGRVREFFDSTIAARPPLKAHRWLAVDKHIEQQSRLMDYATVFPLDGTLLDMQDLLLKFTFMSLFGAAFPLVFLLCFGVILAKTRLGVWKLLRTQKRPLPVSAHTIGIWAQIVDFIIYAAICVNAAMFCFTLGGFENYTLVEQIKLFAALAVAFVSFKLLLEFVFPGTPRICAVLRPRHARLAAKLNSVRGGSRVVARAGVWMSIPPGALLDLFRDTSYVKKSK